MQLFYVFIDNLEGQRIQIPGLNQTMLAGLGVGLVLSGIWIINPGA